MPVASSTIGGVNTWTFSGVVTDAELKTAWAGLIVNGVYVLNRAIYLDATADLTSCTGGFLVDLGSQVNPGFILNTTRDKTKSTFRNFTFLQRNGLVVVDRSRFVMTWNGSALGTPVGGDGLAQSGGGMVYGVPGAPPSGDPRFLNEMSFAGLEGVTIYSQEFTEQELQIVIGQTTQLRGISFEKCFGFPQIGTPTGNVNVVVYRSNQNTQHPTQQPIRLFPDSGRWAAVCYVDSYVTRNNTDITTRLGAWFNSNASNRARMMVLNNYTRESWFGASKAAFLEMGNWSTVNEIWGGVLKKLQFVGADGATIRAYDSRSTTAAQKCAFAETGFVDFLNTSLAPTTDAEGKITIVHIGALATGGSAASVPITRYTNQRYTFQKFGFRVSVNTVDMTAGGDNDLSAFTPVIPVAQEGIARTQAAITAATTVTSFQELLEELHVLAIGLSGSASYAGAHGGNLFTFSGGVLTTSFASVTVDATAASKISFNSATNSLTIKSSVMTDTVDVNRWTNSGTVTLANGAAIQGVYSANGATSKIAEFIVSEGSSIYIGDSSTGITKLFLDDVAAGTYRAYYEPGAAPTVLVARELYGFQRFAEVVTLANGLNTFAPVDIEDVGLTETDLATVLAYTEIEGPSKFYDRTAAFRLTEQGIKLGQMVTRSGKALETGSFSHVINKDAASVYSVAGSVITTKSIEYAGDDKYDTEILTPPATLTANTTEIITIQIEDAAGDSQVSINGGDGTFELWKVTTATATNDYATGTLLDTVGNGIYRFIGVSGFDIVGVDINSNIRRRSSMAKGIYVQAFYVGDQIQLAQAPQVIENGIKLDVLKVELEEIKGAGFASANNSLVKITEAVSATATANAEILDGLEIVNQNVQDASLLIPATREL